MIFNFGSGSYWELMTDNIISSASSKAYSNDFSYSQILPYFLLSQELEVVVSSDKKYFNSTIFVSKDYWAKFFCMTRLSVPSKLPIVVDGAQYSLTSGSWVLQYNLTHMLSDNRYSVYTNVLRDDFSLLTITSVFKSSVWLERELSDFTNLNFIGLLDTRRLLLDYFEQKTSWQTHINNDKNFNESLYDVMLSY